RRAVLRAAGAAMVAWVAINLPAFVASRGNAAEYFGAYLTAGAGNGSVWQLLETVPGVSVTAGTLTWVVLGWWLLVGLGTFAYGVLRGRAGDPVRRAAALAFGLLVIVLVTGKGFDPGYALWLLPLAVLASRNWREVLAW